MVKLILLLSLFSAESASACNSIRNQIDWNCDKKLKIVFVGDSLVAESSRYFIETSRLVRPIKIRDKRRKKLDSLNLLLEIRKNNPWLLSSDYLFISLSDSEKRLGYSSIDTAENIRQIIEHINYYSSSTGNKAPAIKIVFGKNNKFNREVKLELIKDLIVSPGTKKLLELTADTEEMRLKILSHLLFSYIDIQIKRK